MSTTASSFSVRKDFVLREDFLHNEYILWYPERKGGTMYMKSVMLRIMITFTASALLLCIGSCASAPYLITVPTDPREIEGTYTLILYGGRYSSDIENVAILDKEGDQFTFMVYAPEFDYKVKKHISAKEALAEAEAFVRFHYAFWKAQLKGIVDPTGIPIGYEIRPLYYPMDFGYPDVLDIDYILKKDNNVTVMISLKRELRRRFLDDESPFIFRP
ncbi:MAG TPA: hypothetical protein VMU21_00035 [Thermodesulfovibrionales bacterium]|nr:hypothetical protein [Thermodesulfovibrionales bacterium]